MTDLATKWLARAQDHRLAARLIGEASPTGRALHNRLAMEAAMQVLGEIGDLRDPGSLGTPEGLRRVTPHLILLGVLPDETVLLEHLAERLGHLVRDLGRLDPLSAAEAQQSDADTELLVETAEELLGPDGPRVRADRLMLQANKALHEASLLSVSGAAPAELAQRALLAGRLAVAAATVEAGLDLHLHNRVAERWARAQESGQFPEAATISAALEILEPEGATAEAITPAAADRMAIEASKAVVLIGFALEASRQRMPAEAMADLPAPS